MLKNVAMINRRTAMTMTQSNPAEFLLPNGAVRRFSKMDGITAMFSKMATRKEKDINEVLRDLDAERDCQLTFKDIL